MKIIIPTYRRDRQLTYSWFSKETRTNTIFVCDQYDTRKLSFLGLAPEQIWITDAPTIAKKRAWILEECGRRGIEKILMLDDDLRFAARDRAAPWENTKLHQAAPHEIDNAFRYVEELLSAAIPHIGLGPRQGNNNQKTPVESCGRMMYALGYHVPTLLKECELGRIETREDMDYCLQLLRKGFENRVIHWLCVDQSYNNPGGCRDQRTIESSNADADRLAELHPGLVRVVEKDYKASLKRREVVVSWKKALDHG